MFPTSIEMARRRTTTTNEIFKKFGRVSQKSSVLRRIAQKRNVVGPGDKRMSYGARRMSIGNRLLTVDSSDTLTDYV